MAFRVTYTDKSGKSASMTFASETQAQAYARTVRKATIVPVDADAPTVDVQKCPEGTADLQRAAARTFYAAAQDGQKYETAERREQRERYEAFDESAAERYMEAFGAARLNGASVSDALDDANYARARRHW